MKFSVRRTDRRIGMAIGSDGVWMAASSRARPASSSWTTKLGYDPATGWLELAQALMDGRSQLGVRTAHVTIVLLPPIVQLKLISLPRMRRDELAALLSRDAGKYFLSETMPLLAGGIQYAPATSGMATVLAAAAPAPLIDAIYASMPQGWSVSAILPAEAAWAIAGPSDRRPARPALREIIVSQQGFAERLKVRDSRIQSIERRLERSWPVESEASPALAIGGEIEAAGAVAARFAADVARGHSPELVPSRIVRERQQAVLRHASLVGLVAVSLIALAGWTEMWGLHRRLSITTNRRRAISSVVAKALADRSAVEALESRLGALAAAESRTRDWSAVMADIAGVLPSDAYLDAFHASGDTVVLAGSAANASAALAGLRKADMIQSIRANEPISREVQDGGQTIERYSVTTVLTPVNSVASHAGSTP